MQGLGGSRLLDGDIAITFSCNEMRDHDVVYNKGKEQKWIDYKNDFKNWDFELIGDLKAVRRKNVKIWNLIG